MAVSRLLSYQHSPAKSKAHNKCKHNGSLNRILQKNLCKNHVFAFKQLVQVYLDKVVGIHTNSASLTRHTQGKMA